MVRNVEVRNSPTTSSRTFACHRSPLEQLIARGWLAAASAEPRAPCLGKDDVDARRHSTISWNGVEHRRHHHRVRFKFAPRRSSTPTTIRLQTLIEASSTAVVSDSSGLHGFLSYARTSDVRGARSPLGFFLAPASSPPPPPLTRHCPPSTTAPNSTAVRNAIKVCRKAYG